MACNCQAIGTVQMQDFTCVADDAFYEPLTIIDELTGEPINITFWSFAMDIYASYAAKIAAADPLISLANGTGFTIVNGILGRVDLSIAPDQTGEIMIPLSSPYGSDIPQLACVYDLVGTDENGLPRTRLRGSFTFTLRLTNT